MRIRLLGTGTPTPSLRRMSSGYMVEIGDDVILFDQGPGTYHRMMEAGVNCTDVTHVFFSHLHYDHCMDYIRLLMTRWDQSGDKLPELKVYGPPFIKKMTELIIGEDGIFGPDIDARINNQLSIDTFVWRGGVPPRKRPAPEVKELRSGDTVEGNGWKITAGSVVHVQPQLICYGYRMETPEGVFAYSGDSGPCAGMDKLGKEADVVVHMCQYLTGTEPSEQYAKGCMGHLELAEFGTRNNVKNLVVSHVLEQLDVPGVRERVIREMTEIYRGNLFFGEDLMEIPIGNPLPAAMM